MPRPLVFVELVTAMLLCGGVALGADRGWVAGVGGGPLYPSTTDGELLGRSYSIWVAKPLRPWFLFGGEANGYRIDSRQTWDSWSFISYQTGAWDSFMAAATFRVQVPVREGPAPFVSASSGVAWSTGGETYVQGSGYPRGHVYPGPNTTVWSSSIELGVRVAIPGAWPDPELSVRKVAWLDRQIRTLVEPRLAIVF